MTHRVPSLLALGAAAGLALGTAATTQSGTTVVPAEWESVEAPGLSLWPFGPFDARRQLLIDARMLGRARNRAIAGITVRRNGGDGDTLVGGRIVLETWLSSTPHPARHAHETFAMNRGTAPVQVFSGVLDLPDTPPVAAPPAAWSAPDAVSIPFFLPYSLHGSTLCIETTTTAFVDPATGVADEIWWPTDSFVWRNPHPVESLGTSCWSAAGPSPAGAIASTFIAGSNGVFHLASPPCGRPAHCLLGWQDRLGGSIPLPIDLGLLGAPGCTLQVDPATVISAALTAAPAGPRDEARAEIAIPGSTSLAGSPLLAQWFVVDPTENPLGLAATNGVRVTIGSLSGLGCHAWVESPDLGSATGRVIHGRLPVLLLNHL